MYTMPVSKSIALRFLLHSIVWSFFFLAPLLLSPPGDFAKAFLEPDNLLSLVLRNILLIGVFYFNLFYLAPRVFLKGSLLFYVFIVCILITVISMVNWQVHHLLSEPSGPPLPWSDAGIPPTDRPPINGRQLMFASPLFSSFLITSLVIIFSTGLFLWEDWSQTKERAREQAFEKQNAELAALKLQISPHFLFNTLNNIRWLVRSKSDLAEDSLVKLSQLLRYILYETNDEKVELSKEIEHLMGYVELQKMRLADSEALEFSLTGNTENKLIVPLLLLPIAENFFKHGDFESGNRNSFKIRIEHYRILITTENKIALPTENLEKKTIGIGQNNLRRRLQIHYPGNHDFTFSSSQGNYKLHLEILLD